MATPRPVVVLFLGLLVSTPVALGGWSALGNHEPSSTHDVNDGFMFQAPDASGTQNRVYFNGFVAVANQGTDLGSLSPNLGTIQSSMNPMSYEVRLLFGVWVDCNHDGFVGLGDQGLFEYRSEILAGDAAALAACPARSTAPANPATWHNDGQWVREYVPIGWSQGGVATTSLTDLVIVDNSSRAWYDNGYYDERPLNSCILGPQIGTLHSVGGLLFNLDCMDQFLATATFDGVADPVDATAGTHLSFSDAPKNQYASRSTLNLNDPWGVPSDPAYVEAWDCAQDPTTLTKLADRSTNVSQGPAQVNLTSDDGWLAPGVSGVANLAPIYANASSPSPHGVTAPAARPYAPGDASAAGTANSTASGLDQCKRRAAGGGRADTAAAAPYAAEAPASQSNGGNGKQVSQQVMFPDWRDARGLNRARDLGTVSAQSQSVDVGGPASTVLGARAPMNLGTHVVSNDGLWRGGIWASKFASRNYTFYGLVGSGAIASFDLALSHPDTSPYYGEVCPDLTGISATGVDCNPDDWWKDPATHVDISPRSPFLGQDQSSTASCAGAGTAGATYSSTGATTRGCIDISSRVGDPFNLRDVDCIDDGVGPARFANVHATLVAATVFYDQCEPVG